MNRHRLWRLPRAAAAILLAALVAASLSPAPAHAATPLETPTRLTALWVDDTTALLSWVRSGLTETDVVERNVGGVWSEYTRGRLYGQLSLTNLTPGTTYTFRVYSIPFESFDYTRSATSDPMSFTTLSGPDAEPPATPQAISFSSVTTVAASLFWPETTDNVKVTGYHLQQLVDGAFTTIKTVGPGDRSQWISGLNPNTAYTYAVIAFDKRGNQSSRSRPATVTTATVTSAPTCRARVIVFGTSSWTTVEVSNLTAAPIDGWTIRFTLAAGATVSSAFNGKLTQTGTVATITPMAYNRVLNAGGGVTVGFSGQSPTTPPLSDFTFNGIACSMI